MQKTGLFCGKRAYICIHLHGFVPVAKVKILRLSLSVIIIIQLVLWLMLFRRVCQLVAKSFHRIKGSSVFLHLSLYNARRNALVCIRAQKCM